MEAEAEASNSEATSARPAGPSRIMPEGRPRRWFVDEPMLASAGSKKGFPAQYKEVHATPARSASPMKASSPAQALSAKAEKPEAEEAVVEEAVAGEEEEEAVVGEEEEEAVAGEEEDQAATGEEEIVAGKEEAGAEEAVVLPQDCPLALPDEADRTAEDYAQVLCDAVNSVNGSESSEVKASSAKSPMEWEMYSSWHARKAELQMRTWLASLDVKDRANGKRKAIDVASEAFCSGIHHVNGGELVPPPEDELTLPNPEKASNAGQSSNMSMIFWALKDAKRKLARSEEDRARMAAAKANSPRPRRVEHPHAPKAKIYLRKAAPADLHACLAIYNHYVDASVVAGELQHHPAGYFDFRFEDVNHLQLPWIVAVAQHKVRKPSPKPTSGDKIVGYALAEDHSDPGDAWRFTVEMQLFVHPDYLRLGIGRTLMDRLVCLLDPKYSSRGGYRFMEERVDWGELPRAISKILCLIPYPSNNHTEIDWKKRWLSSWDFVEVGNLRQVGVKFGKW